ncbi:Hydroxymethylglutaryl-CoA synthase-like protein AKT4-1 [Frankliniella fusca]|uniref:Hydroxymethylglutaryl-CoA synthase-like protein AKT4-1 n=1 Tax=Frankliniella fusca TaxID=407009 RepID=A0AAE1HVM8_9NEOP|nr:Hydroxymethylglutaryl-CoA synthase-like protein AKT4-1 [Frankliniella fusca]
MRHGLSSKLIGKVDFARGCGRLASFLIAAATFGETQSTLEKLDMNFNLTLIPLTRVVIKTLDFAQRAMRQCDMAFVLK